ncbi:MAG: hypothetical protein IKT50_03290, partial [Clostridia bacterium]|nr:hypothetical protein [Clostridia bacterium]
STAGGFRCTLKNKTERTRSCFLMFKLFLKGLPAFAAPNIKFTDLFRHTNGSLAIGTGKKSGGVPFANANSKVAKRALNLTRNAIICSVFFPTLYKVSGKHTKENKEAKHKFKNMQEETVQKSIKNSGKQPENR